jgi:hypothetical protein
VSFDKVNHEKDEGGRQSEKTDARNQESYDADGIPKTDLFATIPHRVILDGIKVSFKGTREVRKNPEVPNHGDQGDHQEPNLARFQSAKNRRNPPIVPRQ